MRSYAKEPVVPAEGLEPPPRLPRNGFLDHKSASPKFSEHRHNGLDWLAVFVQRDRRHGPQRYADTIARMTALARADQSVLGN